LIFQELHFPSEVNQHIRLRTNKGMEEIWDIIRKKWLRATPEEWVRQHTLSYLLLQGYPASIIAVESGLTTGHRQKRSDVVVYKGSKPYLLVECKAPSVNLSQNTFNQAFNYNTTLNAPWIYLTNGIQHIFFDAIKNEQIAELPRY